MKLADLVRDNKKVRFTFYRDGDLWYETEGKELTFPVPISDIGGAIFLAEDKAILFMRYMKPHIKLLEEAQN